MRVLLSSRLKSLVHRDLRSQGELAALANLNVSQLCILMRDQTGIGPVVRVKVVRLGEILGLTEAECFREVRQ
jgi:hypothetical protein